MLKTVVIRRRVALASWSCALAAAVTAYGAQPRDAHACGGTFCDNGPMAMPVDQTGENIFFVVADGEVEAHIQIQYDPATDAAQFAWIVPILATPTFEVGAQQLFVNLANSTVPSYGWVGNAEQCDDGFDDGGGSFDSCESGADPSGAGDTTGGGGGEDGGTTGGGTEVVLQDTVGAFEAVVLQSATAADLLQWLTDNAYYPDPNAEPILQQYIDEGFQFAAFRLGQSAGVGEIHPVVIRYAGDEPCIPIRLTQIAAQDDMDIRAFFLGETRVAPTNYQHVEINPVKLDWLALGANYKDVVTLAVDSPMSDGHGFVTEYAGDSAIVVRDGLFSDLWDAAAFTDLEPVSVVQRLIDQGLISECGAATCTFNHPLVRGLLLAWLPPPDGISEGEFWGDLVAYEAMIDFDVWDGPAFAAAMQERIIDPGAHALDLLETHPMLTRLYTTLSPQEMTEDPLFHGNAELPNVDNTARVATLYAPCYGSQEMQSIGITPPVYANANSPWPDIAPDEMPWALRIESIPASGAPMVLTDNQMAIEMLVEAYNAGQSGLGPEASCHEESGGANDGDGDGDGGSVGDGSTGSSGSSGGAGQDGGATGCGCNADRDGRAAGWLALGLIALRRRRRAR